MTQTPANMNFGWRHVWIVSVASLGQMIGTALATLVSVLIPMIQIAGRPELTSWQQGLMGAVDLTGIAVGSVVLGRLADRWGYLKCFRLCPSVIFAAALAAVYLPDVWLTYLWLFVMGFGIGGEYSLDSAYVSDLMPAKWRATMVGVTKASSALGNIIVAGVAWVMILHWPYAGMWPKLMWMMVAMSGAMILSRIWFAGSPKWLLAHGKVAEAEEAVHFFLGRNVSLPAVARSSAGADRAERTDAGMSVWDFIRRNGKKVVLTGVPWACEGLGVYGIGVFLPILVLALGIVHQAPHMAPVMHVAQSVEVTLWISCIMLPGFLIGLWLIKRMGHVRQLAWGFYFSGVSLLLLLAAYAFHWPAWISVAAFMSFELFLNLGPHLITYVLPPEVYAPEERSLGNGIAASLGKVGAVLAVFFIPMILSAGGVEAVLWVSAGVMAVGGIVTAVYGRLVRKGVSGEQ